MFKTTQLHGFHKQKVSSQSPRQALGAFSSCVCVLRFRSDEVLRNTIDKERKGAG